MRANCWEYYKCGREPGGYNTDSCGLCQAALSRSYDGENGGVNAGRCCWRVSGSLFGGNADCIRMQEVGNCRACEFFQLVKVEEAEEFRS